jgi:hypothetical protein
MLSENNNNFAKKNEKIIYQNCDFEGNIKFINRNEDHKHKTSYFETLLHLFKGNVGPGKLNL